LTPTVSYNANNQVTWVQNSAPVGFTYDGAGNVTCDGAMSNGACQGTHAYLYDAEGRICAEKTEPIPGTYTMTQYIYNASGARVAKGSITNWAVGCDTTQNGFTLTNSYVLGPHNEQLTEMDGNGNWQHTNVYATGELVATIKQDAVHFHLSDLLGNRRVQSTYNGAVELSCSGLPFGDQQNCSGSGVDAAEHHFTGKERDTESGNDYFGARYYSSSMGRFMSPDEVFADQHPGDPQSWNLYGYGRNNPLKFVDPTGESIYAIFYTVGNDKNDHSDDGGDATFKKAAETMANDIQHEKGFDPKNDVVLTFGVNSKQDFIDALSSIKGLEAYFGKVAQLDLYSHSGNDGPVCPGQLGASRLDRQFMLPGKHGGIDISQLRALDIDWESNAYAAFYGCHTRPFADAFGQAQGVNTFGYKGFSSFFATEGGWLGEYPFSRANTKPGYRGPIYPGSKHILFGDYNDLHQKWLIF
jgi:RHS repeat-associated protein